MNSFQGMVKNIEVPAFKSLPLPLPYVSSELYITPSDCPVKYCNETIHWQNVWLAGEVREKIIKCDSPDGSVNYR